MSEELVLRAVVLGAVDYGDTDRVVTLLTEERGRVAAFAAGARKSRRRFAGALEPFTELEVRATERRGGELLFLVGCEIRGAHAGLRADLAKLAYAGHAAELCRELCREREPHPELFALLRRYLSRLEAADARPEELLLFELLALEHVGLAPRLSDCAICGAAVPGDALFDPPHGGVLCPRCAGMAFPGATPIDGAAREAAAGLRAGRLELPDPRLRARVRAVVRRFTHHVLGRSPRSLEFLSQVGIEG